MAAKNAVKIPIKKAVCKPVNGDRLAKMANNKGSRIIIIATISPAKISFLVFGF
jgi:hypothetical protein